MNIGIDLDGVIQDTEAYFKTYGELFDIETYNTGISNPNGFRNQDRYAWGPEHIEEFMTKYGYNIEADAPLMPAVRDVMVKLKEMGHNLILITARGSISPLEQDIAMARLEKEKLPLDEIVLGAIKKLPVCLEKKIDYMIDDSPQNVRAISDGGIPCLYLRSAYCEDIQKDNVYTVYNWGEILRFFSEKKAK